MDPVAITGRGLVRCFIRFCQAVREAKECPSELRGLRREVEIQQNLFLTDCQELFKGFKENSVENAIETILQSKDDEPLGHRQRELRDHLGASYQPVTLVLQSIDEIFQKIQAVFGKCKLPIDSNPGGLKAIEWMPMLPRKEELEGLVYGDLSKQVKNLQHILGQRQLRNENPAKEANESRNPPGVPTAKYSDSVIVHIRNSFERLCRTFSSLGTTTCPYHYTDLHLRSLCSDEIRSLISSNTNKASCIEFGFTISTRSSSIDDSNQPHSSTCIPITVKAQNQSSTEKCLTSLVACNGYPSVTTCRVVCPPNRLNNRATGIFSGRVSKLDNDLCSHLCQTDSSSKAERILGYIPIDKSYIVYQGEKTTASRISLDHLLSPPINADRQRKELTSETYERVMLALALAFSVLDLGIQSSTWFKKGCRSEEIHFFREKSARYEFIEFPHIEVTFDTSECGSLEGSTESISLTSREKFALRKLFTSLGIVLVEIGYCDLLENAFKEIVGEGEHESDQTGKAQAVAGSIKSMGKKYREIVNDCLSSNFGIDDRGANYMSIRKSFYMKVICKLEELSEFFAF